MKTDGLSGLYNGFLSSVQGIMIYRGAYFGFYDMSKSLFNDPENLPFFTSFLLGLLVTNISDLIGYPWDTVKRRMLLQAGQPFNERKYRNNWDCWRKILQQEGVSAFFGGANANVIRATGGALVLVLYDRIRKLL